MQIRVQLAPPDRRAQFANIRRWKEIRSWSITIDGDGDSSGLSSESQPSILVPVFGSTTAALTEALHVLSSESALPHRFHPEIAWDDEHVIAEAGRPRIRLPHVERIGLSWRTSDRRPPLLTDGAATATLWAICHSTNGVEAIRRLGFDYVWLTGLRVTLPGRERREPFAHIPILYWERREDGALGIVLDAYHDTAAPGRACYAQIDRG